MKTLRLVARFLFFLSYTFVIVAEIWLRGLLHGPDVRRAMRVRRRWARNLLSGVGLDIDSSGDIPDFPCLIVGNHRSYLDPILLLRDVDAYPVAKAELASWPIIGKGARMAGILYLKRENSSSRSDTLRLIGKRIEAGFQVMIFPEGTTSDLPGTLPFRKGAFQLAARDGFPIVPVALCFESAEDFWVGSEGFLAHGSRRFREKTIRVKIVYGPALHGTETDVLLEQTKNWIEGELLRNKPLI